MKHIRVRTIMVFVAAGLAGALLLHTSQSVQTAEDKLAQMKASVQQEKDSIRLLNAEWAYLNNPERLEKLAREYLNMMPPQPSAMLTEVEAIPAKITEEEMAAPPDPGAMVAQPVSFIPPKPARKPSFHKPPSKPTQISQNIPQVSPQVSPNIKSKPSDKDFTALLKNIQKGGTP